MSLNSFSHTKGSFFDDDTSLSKFEFSTSDGFEVVKETHEPLSIQGSLLCKNFESKDTKCGFYTLYRQYLVYSKNESNIQPEGILNIMHAALQRLTSCDKEMGYGFALIKNGKKYEFYSKEKKVIDDWIFALRDVCVLTDFYEAYKVLKMLGKGSFAKVYLAECNVNKKLFAVKSFKKDAILTSNRKRSLISEIEILRTLHHDNIVKLHQIYETDHSVFLILDYVDGKTLEDTITQSTFKDDTYDVKVFNIMQGLLDVLAYLASKGIMHRDLKPGNILLEKGEKVKVFDFGISTCINVNQYIFNKCGTPGYIAPEVFGFDPKDCSTRYNDRCDVFSSGCIFHYLLFGKLLFEAPEDLEIMRLNRSFNVGTNVLQIIQQKHKSKFETVSKEAIDLLLKLIEADHHVRISAEKALKHPYFTPFPIGMPKVNCSNKYVYEPLSEVRPKQTSPKFTLEEVKAKRTSAQNSVKLQARLAILEKESSLLSPTAPQIEERTFNLTPPAAIFRREIRPTKTMDLELLGIPMMGQIKRNRSHSFDDSTEQNPNANVPNTVVVEKLQKIKEPRIDEQEEDDFISFVKEEKSAQNPISKKKHHLTIIPEVINLKERRGSGSTVEDSPCPAFENSSTVPVKDASKPYGKPKRRFNVFGGKKEAVKGAS